MKLSEELRDAIDGGDECRGRDSQLTEWVERAEGLEADAERYRWLRSEDVATDPRYYQFWQEFNAKLCREERMDSAIDAARHRQTSAPDITDAVIDSPQPPLA